MKIELEKLKSDLQNLFNSLHAQQVEKAAIAARRINPRLTAEDLLNPDNFQDVINDPKFVYEDGIAAGILSAQMAVRAFLNELK